MDWWVLFERKEENAAVSLVSKMNRLNWFGYAKCKDSADWSGRCKTVEQWGRWIIQRRYLRKPR